MDQNTNDPSKPVKETPRDSFSELNNFHETGMNPPEELASQPEVDSFPELQEDWQADKEHDEAAVLPSGVEESTATEEAEPEAESDDQPAQVISGEQTEILPKQPEETPQPETPESSGDENLSEAVAIPTAEEIQPLAEETKQMAYETESSEAIPSESVLSEEERTSLKLPDEAIDTSETIPMEPAFPDEALGSQEKEKTQPVPVTSFPAAHSSEKDLSEQAAGVQPEPSKDWFEELAGFKESKTQPEAQPTQPPEPVARSDFYTGHWSQVDQPSRASNGKQSLKPANSWTPEKNEVSAIRAEDDIPTIPPTIPPAPSAPVGGNILPSQVSETDLQATVLTPTAFTSNPEQKKGSTQPIPVEHTRHGGRKDGSTRPNRVRSGKPARKRKPWLVALSIFLALIVIGITFAIVQYFRIASTLPDVSELSSRASQFETTRILDRNGNILYEIVDPNEGKRTYVPLERISPYLIAATIATEDKEYYNHPGFDVVALGRALWQNYTSGEIVSGASTITQQLARMLLLSDERFEQTYDRKAKEIILAAEITRRYSKDEVLELYLNEIFYGNLSYGIEAAAETYFNTTAADLELWQSSFLAGLPQSPAIYDIYNNRDATLTRNKSVLVLMYELSKEKGCIYVGESHERVCVDAVQALDAADTVEAYTFTPSENVMRFPHWVVYIQSLLEAQFDAQTIYRSGFTVYTTLDPDLQTEAQQAVQDQLAGMTINNATNGAVVAMNPNTGEILAMVGSADFYSEAISGQVNMALSQTRQPGSSIKPITYLAAFEKDWTPATLIWDVPSSFPPSGQVDDPSPEYVPVNYDSRFHGPVTVRSALANSYNVAAVKTLEYVGIYDDPSTPQKDGFISMAERLGITSLTRDDYGLSLTLGGGEVSLLEMTGAYSVLANEGRKVSPVAITKVVDLAGETIYEYVPPEGDQVVRQAHAYLISSILSDSQARIPAFGAGSVLELPFEAAVKTGTTNDYRDNWTIGYTPDLVVGVWVGNADYSPMVNTSGVSGAAPIWSRVMQSGIQQLYGGVATPFSRPADVVDKVICSVSGTEPSEDCPAQRSEVFASDQLPLPKTEDLWARLNIDTWTGLTASSACPDFTKEQLVINVEDEDAIRWLKEDQGGKQWADNYGFPDPIVFIPERECRMDDSRAIIDLTSLANGQTIRENPFKIIGVIDATSNFKDYRIEFGEGENPDKWTVLVDWENTPVRSADEIYLWDLEKIEATVLTVRVTMRSTQNTQVEKSYTVSLALPTPTPTSTPTATMTPTPTLTPANTSTAVPSNTPTTQPSSTETPLPTETPVPSPTETPLPIPT
ncbi:MAG: transglycosylase domain-containing protein [Anaerolineaceae bacterium]